MIRIIAAFILLALLGWIVIPNILVARDRSRQKRTMADMRSVAAAWEARATDLNSYTVEPDRHYATDGNDLRTLHRVSPAELQRVLEPTYIRKLPLTDGWGYEFDFRTGGYKGKDAQTYALRAVASDGRDDGLPNARGPVTRFKDDIVYVNGSFAQYPEGT